MGPQPLRLGWCGLFRGGTHRSAGSSQASASPSGSAVRQAHGEEGQRDQRGFSIINHPSEAFPRMVSESPSLLPFPQERRREGTKPPLRNAFNRSQEPVLLTTAIAVLESIQSQKSGTA